MLSSQLLIDQVKPDYRRKYQYLALAAGLTVLYILLRGSDWRSSAELHTVMEAIATLLSLLVGVMALVRHYTQKNNIFLFIGTGFLGTAMLDGYHAIVTSTYFAAYLPSDLSSLIPWSWTASRLFLGLMMFLSYLAWRREDRLGEAGQIAERSVYVLSAVMTIAGFLFFAFVPLPRAYYPELVFHRPEEFMPAILFLLALIGYLKKGVWAHNRFEHWLVISLIVGLVAQVVFMPFSGQLFDYEFDMAHLLKKASYVCVLIGLLVSMRGIFLQAAETGARIDGILTGVVDGIITIDSQGKILTFNNAAEHIFGYDRDEVLGHNVKMLTAEPYQSEHDGYIRSFVETGKAKIIGLPRDVTGRRKNGEEFPMGLAVAEAPVAGQQLFVGICRDITKPKQVEREREEAYKELDSFAYSVSHDLRGPLRAIDGFSRAVVEDFGDKIPEEGRDYLARIINGCGRMGGIIDSLLSLSRISRSEIKMQDIDLSALATEVSAEISARDTARSLDLVIEPDLMVRGDERLVRVLLQNLLGNAWKFTRHTTAAKIEVGYAAGPDSKAFYVKDNGAGFDMAFADKLFKPFERLHTADEFDGTGIGLATVARIVQRHNGRIWAESEVDKGATIFFVI